MTRRPAAALLLALGASALAAGQVPPVASQAGVSPPGLLPLKLVAELSPGGRPLTPALLEAGRLVLSTEAGAVECFDAGTGSLRWRLGLPGAALLPPGPGPNAILLARRDGLIFWVDPDRGEILREVLLISSIALAPFAREKDLYLATEEGELVSLNPSRPGETWRVATGEPLAALAGSRDLLVASGARGTLTALDAESGKLRWKFQGQAAFQAPAVFDRSGERLFIGDAAGGFYSLSTRSGSLRFRWQTGAAIPFPALVEEDRVYVASYANTLFAYRPGSGHELWRAELLSRPASRPVRAGSRIALATLSGEVVEFDPATGRRGQQVYRAPSEILPAPSFDPPRVALFLRSGKVLLLETGSAPDPSSSR